jgi:RNA polymerase sigma-70 factor (ECF subfamily)
VIGHDFDALLVAAQSGSEAAVGSLYRDLNPTLVRFLGAQVAGSGEDLAQEVWLAAANGLASFSGDEDGFRAWMFTIARRQLISHWRRAGRRPQQVVDPADLPEPRASSEDRPDSRILADEAVLALIAGLPREQAEIVLLRVVAGFDAEQVGVIVGKRAGTVRVLQHRALRRMARRFAEESVTK